MIGGEGASLPDTSTNTKKRWSMPIINHATWNVCIKDLYPALKIFTKLKETKYFFNKTMINAIKSFFEISEEK